MRAHRVALVVSCCALSLGCSRQSADRPSSAVAPAAPTTGTNVAPINPAKKVALSEIPSGQQFGATAGSLDVNSLNPVKMDQNAATGSRFNPFAR